MALLHSFEFAPAIESFDCGREGGSRLRHRRSGASRSAGGGIRLPPASSRRRSSRPGGRRSSKGERDRRQDRARARLHCGRATAVCRLREGRSADTAASRIAMRWPRSPRSTPTIPRPRSSTRVALVAANDPTDQTYARPAEGGCDPRTARADAARSSRLRALHHPRLRRPAARAQGGRGRARATRKIAPSAPHALHMPSHTFTRLGYWQDSIDTNIASAAAARREGATAEELHAMDYQAYAYLQTGAGPRGARRMVDALPEIAGAIRPQPAPVRPPRGRPASSRWPRFRRATRSSARRGARRPRSSCGRAASCRPTR